MLQKKISLLGDFAVGKTSLIRRFVDNQFGDQYLSTVGVKISRKMVEVTSPADGSVVPIQLLIWDLEGSSHIRTPGSQYIRGSSGAIVVADLTRETSLASLQNHIEFFHSVNPTSSIVVGLNKMDLSHLSPQTLPALGNHHHVISVYNTSAKNGTNVELLFHTLAQTLIEDRHG